MRAGDRAFWAPAVILSIALLIAATATLRNRYGARMTWLAAFVVTATVLARKSAHNETPGLPQ
jgi:hypothetical protein